MPSYSQYKRQMAVMDADDANIETWITVKGNHIPIMKGQSKEEAVQSFLEKKGKSSSGAKTVMKPDIEKPRSTTVVSKGSGKAKYKVGDVTKQGKIKEVIPARLSDTPYYKLENGKTYLEEELHAEKPAKKVSQSLKDDVDYYFTERQAGEKAWKHWNKIREDVISKRGEGVLKDIKKVQKTGYYTPSEILSALESGNKFDDMLKSVKPANKGWLNARSGHPETIGKAVRRVVKKIGEQRAESKKPAGGSSSGWPESPKFEKLTEKYMPKSGAADNELGEALRSINQAVYRYYNDGDMYNKGYGKETVNAAIKHLTQLSKNKATPRHIARGIDNGLYELKTYGLKDKGRYETALKILLQTFEFADEKDIDALSKMKRNNG